jgi:hypothetical protein
MTVNDNGLLIPGSHRTMVEAKTRSPASLLNGLPSRSRESELELNDTKRFIESVLKRAPLPSDVFTASYSLGWTYQFWQSKRKKEVNESGSKIGADELSPVTQLFTEDYMVDFLLDNTLGAWHAGKVLAANPKLATTAQNEEELRQAVSLPGCPWKYLRFIKVESDGKPEDSPSSLISPPSSFFTAVP